MMRIFVPLRQMTKINRLCCCVENEDNLTLQERIPYVGIQENVGKHPKLNALVKHRYSHFHVNEIGLDGKLVQLTDLKPPPRTPVGITPDEPFHVHCTLYKERVAHSDVLDYLVRKLRINGNDIGTAGIKDKWGKTSQKMSIRNVDPSALAAVSERNHLVKLGNFTYEKHPIATGDLFGNHFRILLLDVNSPTGSSSVIADDIRVAMTSLKDFGFINYFGMQRFAFDHRSQIIGRAMVQMDWEQVFDLVLSPRNGDPDFITAAKELWFSKRDPIEIIKNFPADVKQHHKKTKEFWLLQGLAEHYNGGKGDLIEAYKTIPQHFRLLNYSAFKSFLWNHLVSYRIRTFGLKPIPGDIVKLKSATGAEENSLPFHLESTVAGGNEGADSDLLCDEVRRLTEDDFDSNGNCRNYSIDDVVLQTPGSRMSKCAHPKMQSYFEMLLEVNGLEFGCFATFREKFRDVAEPSNPIRDFRHVVQRPINLTYQIVPYTQKGLRDLDHFISSDLDLLRINQKHFRRVKKLSSETECKHDYDGEEKIGVVVEFSLPKGAYATIALRELLHCTNTWK